MLDHRNDRRITFAVGIFFPKVGSLKNLFGEREPTERIVLAGRNRGSRSRISENIAGTL
jgi:hypothetical protein